MGRYVRSNVYPSVHRNIGGATVEKGKNTHPASVDSAATHYRKISCYKNQWYAKMFESYDLIEVRRGE